jgi:CheY-like chemotaxis protein
MSDTIRQALVVDDSDFCSTTLEIALASIPGLTVRSTATAEEALGMLGRESFVALLTDVHLPGMDGIEFVERVRSLYCNSRMSIIVITGDTDPGTHQRARAIGADAVFAKPWSPAAVRRTLERLLRESNLGQ